MNMQNKQKECNVQRNKQYIYYVSEKKQDTISFPVLRQMFTDFQNSFSVRLSSKFATKSLKTFHHAVVMSLHYLVKYLCSKSPR